VSGSRYPVLEGERLRLRPPAPEDMPALLAIIQEPAVSEWWVGYTLRKVQDEFLHTGEALVIEIDGAVAGALLIGEENDPEYRHAAFDIFLGTAWHGRRYGPEALSVIMRHLIDQGHRRFTLDPNVRNAPAIRSYERLGFRAVGRMRDYQRRPDGTYEDGLLMDWLLRDFPDGPRWR